VGLPEFLSLVAGVLAVIGYAAFTARFVVYQLTLAADEVAAWADRRQSRGPGPLDQPPYSNRHR
jgi:hypothetical protein